MDTTKSAVSAAKQFLYAVIVLFAMLIVGFSILVLAKNHGPQFTRNLASRIQRDAAGGGIQQG